MMHPYQKHRKYKTAITIMMIYLLAALCVFSFGIKTAFAREIIYDSTTQQVKIKAGTPTIFRFSKSVQTITGASKFQIEPANKADPSYQVLSVAPRFNAGYSNVNFLLSDGSVIKTKISIVNNDPQLDGIYDFKNYTENSNYSDSKNNSSNVQNISEIDLLKAMIRDDEVSGYKVSRVLDEISSKITHAQMTLIRIYKGGNYNGYVLKVVNTSPRKNIEIDIRKLSVGEPNLAIIAESDDALLLPKEKGKSETYIHIVAKNTASSRDLIFPMESVDPKQDQKK